MPPGEMQPWQHSSPLDSGGLTETLLHHDSSPSQTPIGLALTDATSKAESSWAQSPSSGLCFSLTENKPPKAKMHSERSRLDWRNRSVKKMG